MYYRQAIQMVPDIDFRVSHSGISQPTLIKGCNFSHCLTGPVEEVASDVCRLSIACENMTITGPMCQPERPCTVSMICTVCTVLQTAACSLGNTHLTPSY